MEGLGVGVFLDAAFLELAELLACLAVEVLAVHDEDALVDVVVLFEQRGGLENAEFRMVNDEWMKSKISLREADAVEGLELLAEILFQRGAIRDVAAVLIRASALTLRAGLSSSLFAARLRVRPSGCLRQAISFHSVRSARLVFESLEFANEPVFDAVLPKHRTRGVGRQVVAGV